MDLSFSPTLPNMAAVEVSHPSPFHPSPIRHLSPLLSQTLNEASTPFSFFILPDLVSYCAFPLSSQPNANRIATHSTNWLVEGSSELSPRRRAALQSLKVIISLLCSIVLHIYLCPTGRPIDLPLLSFCPGRQIQNYLRLHWLFVSLG